MSGVDIWSGRIYCRFWSSWFTDERPAEINDFWVNAYPEIDTIPNQIAKIHKAGYLPVATFILPENCWTEHYFAAKIEAQKIFLHKYAGNKIAEEFSSLQFDEEELYSKYKAFYGYTFFIAKKIELWFIRTPYMLRGCFRKRSVSVWTDGEYDVWKIRLWTPLYRWLVLFQPFDEHKGL